MDLDAINVEWFEEQLAAVAEDVSEMMEVFKAMAEADRLDEASEWAQQLFQKVSDENQIDAALQVLTWLASVDAVDDVEETVKKLFSKDRNALKMVEPAGFGGQISVAECFRRLDFLRSLKEGMLCYNATWGMGVIEDIDTFYQQIEIDFERKGDHEMAFNYAAEALEILTEDHILAIRHNNKPELDRLIKEEPAEVVKITLRSYGNMPVTRVQEMLSPSVVSEQQWKKFWAAARSVLKNDASVEIPKKRSDNIILHKIAMAYDDTWFKLILELRDIEKLFERFKEILEKSIDYSSEFAQEALANRLGFIINGAPSGRPEWKSEGLIYARKFEIKPLGVDEEKLIAQLVGGDLILTFDRLPSNQLKNLLVIFIEQDREAVIARLDEVIPVVSHPVLNEILAALLANGVEAEVQKLITRAVARRKASAPMLLWCQRSPEYVKKWNLISEGDLAFRIQEVLEINSAGAMLRAQNQLRERFQQEDWLHVVMDAMTAQQRRDFLRRIHEGHGWDALDRKSVIAKMLRKYPELQDIILPTGANAVKKEIPFTSSRSYAKRQEQLERIMTVEIPENSKEIEVARSHGDLRENAEFKYAKERQGLLMAQGAQLAEDLERVKPNDFANIPTDEVVMGTGVTFEYADGTGETYFILGAWDQDEELSIISSETRLAKSLIGHSVGDEVEIPEGVCVIKEILPLSESVKSWIKS